MAHKLRRGHAALQAEFDRSYGAARIRNFEVLLFPGLLQTADYARYRVTGGSALHGTRHRGCRRDRAARMRRQEVLYDTGKTFEFVITEAALRRCSARAQVMLGQLDRLLSIGARQCDARDHPHGGRAGHGPVHGFLMLDDAAIVETYDEENESAKRSQPPTGDL